MLTMLRFLIGCVVLWAAADAWAQSPEMDGTLPQSEDTSPEPPYYDLGDYSRAVTSAHEDAGVWFNRGLLQAYGFNHEEAVRCFEQALSIDSTMAMAHWGIAYALGPNYNNPVMEDAASQRAHAAVQQAEALAASTTATEQALIGALAQRYAWPDPDRAALDATYAEAMRRVWRQHADDADVSALAAEALMQLRPWGLWDPDGTPAPETPEIQALLEKSLEAFPDHPALCHLYIHTMEPSPQPEKAIAAANRLRDRVPEAGHLVHMPSHIDVLMGDYEAVIRANQKAIVADKKFVERSGRMNFYTLYRLHDYHFLVYGAMFDGQQDLAMSTAEELVQEIPAELLEAIPDFVEAFVPTPLHVLVRFGRWRQILTWPEYPESQPYSNAIRRYARTLSYASTNDVNKALKELELLGQAVNAVPESRLLFNNTCRDILQVALAMSKGEVEYRRGNHERAFQHLRHAVQLDDALNYDEPWGWMQPARHALGALLLEQGHLEEAEQVYRTDLGRHPNNGWALHGLAEALRRQGAEDEAVRCDTQLADAWTRSDITLKASCFCRIGKK